MRIYLVLLKLQLFNMLSNMATTVVNNNGTVVLYVLQELMDEKERRCGSDIRALQASVARLAKECAAPPCQHHCP